MILNLGLAVAALLTAPATAPVPTPTTAPTVTVTIESDAPASGPTTYRVVLQNPLSTPLDLTVTQQLPDEANKLVAKGGKITGHRIDWPAKLQGGATLTLQSTAVLPATHEALSGSACAANNATGGVVACAATLTAAAGDDASSWTRWIPLALLVIGVGLAGWLLFRFAKSMRGKEIRLPRRLMWVPVVIGVVLLFGIAIAGLALISRDVKGAVTAVGGPNGGGWSGPRTGLAIGSSGADANVDFTVYQAFCAGGWCTVDASMHNRTGKAQTLYASMQRLYTSDTEWVSPNTPTTLQANGGTDPFAQPLAAGETRLMAIRFTIPMNVRPTRLELREGAFARGAYLDMKS
ncbi:hypothetical protein [Hamadaea tsunoensis]|uniref:hypothetical protein n=1 Tax=Hamadaea tsunoensis TaxID=53368 RepID=UPI000408913F|nr:hypothetical protein [Hamadaea tsunoensis]